MYHLLKKHFSRRVFYFAIGLLSIFVSSALVANAEIKKTNFTYESLMRQSAQIKSNKVGVTVTKGELSDNINSLKSEEREKLTKLGVSQAKQSKYFDLLEAQKASLNVNADTAKDQIINKDVKIPQEPGTFIFGGNDILIKSINNLKIAPQLGQVIPRKLKLVASIDPVFPVDSLNLPSLEDVQSDGAEVTITAQMRELAQSLENNPVKIVNFVRSSVEYESYFGAKKGADGCLKELLCNDVDASSLTIALLRAAEIPARYEKSIAIFTVDQLKKLLGVDETKTVFAALAMNKVPVFTLTNRLDGVSLDQADFGPETFLAIEWTHVQAYYDYDQKGANINNTLTLSTAASTDAMRQLLAGYPKKQWIPVDAMVKEYAHHKYDVLADFGGWNSETFWLSFFQYQGDLNPINKYINDLKQLTGRDVSDNYSTKSISARMLSKLPSTLPYFISAGDNNRIHIDRVAYTAVPNDVRQQVKISMLRDGNNEVVFSKTFYGTEVNNSEMKLGYEGLTDIDKNVIAAHGGIAQTPSALVDIAPYIDIGDSVASGVEENAGALQAVSIGDTLVLKFEYIVAGQVVYHDEKFSVAGNSEGIYIVLSKVQDDPELIGETPEERAQLITFKGNAALAREYLKQLEESGKTIKQSLDYEYNTMFSRAVITQNRVLNSVNGIPTTFDFKGLSLDAATYIIDYSNRSNYKNHQKDFRLIWTQQASYLEGQVIQDITGLDTISTTKGFQYVNANPATYSMHHITAANEQEIEQLALSDNTKAHMHSDVQAGNTIYTPDKLVQKGNWSGILYISLRPDWTGTYAIGEQAAQNGAFSTKIFDLDQYVDQNGTNHTVMVASLNFVNDFGKYFYEDLLWTGNTDHSKEDRVSCSISLQKANEITSNALWQASYGFPCLKKTVNFGDVSHTYIYAANAVKFFGNGYEYWETRDNIIGKIDAYISQNSPQGHKNNRWFSTRIGTFVQSICETQLGIFSKCNDSDDASVYYSPVQNGGVNGAVYKARGNYLEKLAENDNAVVLTLGFPTSDRLTAAQSPFGTDGTYQNFANGQIYSYLQSSFVLDGQSQDYIDAQLNSFSNLEKRTYYIQGGFAKGYNETYGGSSGQLGFPASDPITGKSGHVIQVFESDEQLNLDPNFKALGIVGGKVTLETYTKYQCELNDWLGNDFVSSILSPFIMAHGFLDSVGNTVVDFIDLAKELSNPLKVYDDLQKLDKAIGDVNINQIVDGLTEAGKNAIIAEWNTSIGPNGCQSRRAYITGRLVGEAVLLWAPFSGLKANDVVKAVSIAANVVKDAKELKLVVGWVKYVELTVESLKELVVVNKFELADIQHVILGVFDDAGKYTGKGLHSAETLKTVMDDGVVEVWNETETLHYKTFEEIPTDANGIRKVYISQKSGQNEFKSIFPSTWTNKDIVDGIVEASDALTPSGFSKNVTKHGSTIRIDGYFKPNGMISTGFPYIARN